MTDQKSITRADEAFILGAMLILLGLACNEWLLAALLSPDGVLSGAVKIQIRAFQAGLIVIGTMFVAFRNVWNRGEDGRLVRTGKIIVLRTGSLAFIMAVIEIGLLYVNTKQEQRLQWHRDPLLEPSPILGYKSRPNITARSTKTYDGQVLFDAVYTTDEYGRRSTPAKSAKEFILFFGASFTFGYGVNDEETLPYQLARKVGGYRVYNYGLLGYGPQQMLAKLQSGELRGEVGEPTGVAIYVFIPDHVRRAIGSMRKVTQDARHFPCFEIDGDQLVHRGTFLTTRPRRLWLSRWINEEQILKFLGVDFPLRLSQRHLDLTARIVEESRKAFHAQFASDRFYVLLWPKGSEDEFDGAQLIPAFEQAGAKILDYSDLVNTTETGYIVRPGVDRHPTARTFEAVAQALARDIPAPSF